MQLRKLQKIMEILAINEAANLIYLTTTRIRRTWNQTTIRDIWKSEVLAFWRCLEKKTFEDLEKIFSLRWHAEVVFFCLDAAWLNVAVVRAVALLSATNGEKSQQTLGENSTEATTSSKIKQYQPQSSLPESAKGG